MFTAQKLPGGKALKDQPKEFFGQLLSSQMTTDVYEDVKPKKIKVVTMEDGQELVQHAPPPAHAPHASTPPLPHTAPPHTHPTLTRTPPLACR